MNRLNLSNDEKEELHRLAQDCVDNAVAKRAKLILMLNKGESRDTVMRHLGCDSRFISRWSKGFMQERLAGVCARRPVSKSKHAIANVEAQILHHTNNRRPGDGSYHWSSRKLAKELGNVSPSAVLRIWRKHAVRPGHEHGSEEPQPPLTVTEY
jgi:hypothetical protein